MQTVAELMVSKKIGCVPVLQGEDLVGIVSQTNTLELSARSGP